MKVDYIIVGLGLAGLAFVEELIAADKSFVVFEDASQTSSLVAGGVYNPVILKRFTPVWNAPEQLAIALPFYESLERKFSSKFDTKFITKKVFKSIEDQNNWFLAVDKPVLSDYMDPVISHEKHNGIVADYGFGQLQGTGRIDTEKLVQTYRDYLRQEERIYFEKFDYDLVQIEKDHLVYKELVTSHIVFCEGYGMLHNPFFNYLPLKEAKGELITIHAPDLKIDFLLKSSLFVLPLGESYYKVGATFNWTDKTSDPTEEGKRELMENLKKVLDVPYTIVGQSAGIRPTVKDRRPLVGIHPQYNKLLILNGLGTRGVMIAPVVAKNLFEHIENGADLDPEVDIKRFN